MNKLLSLIANAFRARRFLVAFIAWSLLPLPIGQASSFYSWSSFPFLQEFNSTEEFVSNVWHGIFSPSEPSTFISTSEFLISPVPLSTPALPRGSDSFSVIQGGKVWPKIIRADINPVDAHINDVQHLSVTLESPVEIKSVQAIIYTDHRQVEVDLAESSAPESVNQPSRYALNNRNGLRIKSGEDLGVKSAAAEELLKTFYFSGSWKVEDTHNASYQTKLVATDVLGRSSSVALAWSDACGIPNDGSYTLSSNCTISSVDGVDNGDLVIATGTTLTLNSTFAYNPGKTVTLNGAVAIGSGGQFKKTYLWMIDGDADGYASNSIQYAQDSAPAGGRRRYMLVTSQYDCNDANASIYPGVITSSGSCGSCTYSATCANVGSGSYSYTYCSSNGSYTSASGSCTCTRDTTGAVCSSWSSCSGSYPSCTGTQTASVCSAGTCSGTTSQSCNLANGTFCSGWSACSGTIPSGSCSASGTQAASTCSNGSCSGSTSQSCVLTATNGTLCGSYGSCSGSVAYPNCSASGIQTAPTCNSGSCSGSTSRSCVVYASFGTSCGSTSYGTCGSCTYSSTCTNIGSGTQSYTSYACNGSGSCISGSGTQSCSCTRNTNGTACGSYSVSACSGSNYCSTANYVCSSGSCSFSSYSGCTACTCGCSCGTSSCGCSTVYNCSRCSDTYACQYASFNSCSSACTSPFNVSYSFSSGCASLCGSGYCSSACNSCGPCP